MLTNDATILKIKHEVVYQVASGQMHRDGYKFYLSVNNVWLTKEVPTKYLER